MKYLIVLSLLILNACSPESQTMRTEPSIQEEKVEIPVERKVPRQEFKWVTEDGGQSQLDFNPRIDILFVIDNSDSMKSAQENLKRNINKFTEGIFQNPMIDYHIGVTSSWDSSERAIRTKKDSFQIGDLRNIKDASGKMYKQRFLDRKIATPELLASTIHIGITPFEQGGPENEEFFAPLMSALEKNGRGATNEGFFRDDAQLVVIIMTDADESQTRISPDQVEAALVNFKMGQKQKVSVYGVLVDAADPDTSKDWALKVHPQYHPECFDLVGRKKVRNSTCTSFGPERLKKLILSINNQGSASPEKLKEKFIMRLTKSDYGSDLSRIGSDITVKTLEKTILLQQIPRFDEKENRIQVRVRYGTPEALKAGKGQLIPEGTKGWRYNPDDNSIYLSGHIRYQYTEGARFAVDYIPVTLRQ